MAFWALFIFPKGPVLRLFFTIGHHLCKGRKFWDSWVTCLYCLLPVSINRSLYIKYINTSSISYFALWASYIRLYDSYPVKHPQEKIPSTRYWILFPDIVSPIVYKASLFLTIWNVPHRRSPVLVWINKPDVPQKKMDKVEWTKAKTKSKGLFSSFYMVLRIILLFFLVFLHCGNHMQFFFFFFLLETQQKCLALIWWELLPER